MTRRDQMMGFAAGLLVGVCLCSTGLVLLFAFASLAEVVSLIRGALIPGLAFVPADPTVTMKAVQPTAIPLPKDGRRLGGTPAPVGIATSTNPPGPHSGKLGDAVEGGGYSLSALAVEDPAKPGIDLWYAPEPGTKRIAVYIVVGCVACETTTVDPVFAILVDAGGSPHMAELGPLIDYDEIQATEIGPGESARGWAVFEVPDTAVPSYVKYLFGNGITLQAGLAE